MFLWLFKTALSGLGTAYVTNWYLNRNKQEKVQTDGGTSAVFVKASQDDTEADGLPGVDELLEMANIKAADPIRNFFSDNWGKMAMGASAYASYKFLPESIKSILMWGAIAAVAVVGLKIFMKSDFSVAAKGNNQQMGRKPGFDLTEPVLEID